MSVTSTTSDGSCCCGGTNCCNVSGASPAQVTITGGCGCIGGTYTLNLIAGSVLWFRYSNQCMTCAGGSCDANSRDLVIDMRCLDAAVPCDGWVFTIACKTYDANCPLGSDAGTTTGSINGASPPVPAGSWDSCQCDDGTGAAVWTGTVPIVTVITAGGTFLCPTCCKCCPDATLTVTVRIPH